MSLIEFLRYAGTGPGINAVIGVLLSLLADMWPGYGALEPKAKRLVMMVMCFIVPVLSLSGLVALGAETFTTDTIWYALAAGFASFWGSQAAHAVTSLE